MNSHFGGLADPRGRGGVLHGLICPDSSQLTHQTKTNIVLTIRTSNQTTNFIVIRLHHQCLSQSPPHYRSPSTHNTYQTRPMDLFQSKLSNTCLCCVWYTWKKKKGCSSELIVPGFIDWTLEVSFTSDAMWYRICTFNVWHLLFFRTCHLEVLGR